MRVETLFFFTYGIVDMTLLSQTVYQTPKLTYSLPSYHQNERIFELTEIKVEVPMIYGSDIYASSRQSPNAHQYSPPHCQTTSVTPSFLPEYLADASSIIQAKLHKGNTQLAQKFRECRRIFDHVMETTLETTLDSLS